MSFVIVLAALAFLMFAAYRGYSVILFAPIAALGAVLLTDPGAVAPVFSGIFMEKMVGFVKLYFPVFLLGAVFGKVIELSGFSESIVAAAIRYIGRSRANAVIVAVCALLTYGGVSLFVVVFAVYPFAAELYRQSNIPKRLMPGAIALGAFSFTMDSLPGTPQIQNIIPTTFFNTTGWAAPWLGTIGAVLTVIIGIVLASAFSAILVYAQELIPGKVGMVAGLFFGFAFGMGGVGAAVLGQLADATSITYVYKVCSFLPLIGVLTVFLPDVEGKRAKA